MNNKTLVIIWDFNGTIIDDVKPSLKSVNDMLIKRNLPTTARKMAVKGVANGIMFKDKVLENVANIREEADDICAEAKAIAISDCDCGCDCECDEELIEDKSE